MSDEGRPASASLPSGASLPAPTVFFGSGRFGVPVLEALRTLPEVELVGVVTLPERPAGRHAVATPTPVAAAADAAGLHVLRLASVRTPGSLERVAALGPELGVLADFGRIVPPALLELPRRGILNVHPSLLPRHRGATPIPATILAGDTEAGVTIIRMDEGLDTGPVVARESWGLRGDETAPELEEEAARVAGELVRSVVPAWLAGELETVPQPDDGATLTRPFRREDGRLDASLPASRLERMVRALRPWPGAYLETASGRLGVLEASIVPAVAGDRPGRLVADGDGVALATAEGRLRLERVLPAGSRAMAGADFRRGAGRMCIGTRVVEARPSG